MLALPTRFGRIPTEALPQAQFIDEVSRTLAAGRFLLLVVGDGIRENVDPHGSKQGITLFVLYTDGSWQMGWTIQHALGLPTRLGVDYAKSVAALFSNMGVQKAHPDTLSRFPNAAELRERFDAFMQVVRNFVGEIVATAKE